MTSSPNTTRRPSIEPQRPASQSTPDGKRERTQPFQAGQVSTATGYVARALLSSSPVATVVPHNIDGKASTRRQTQAGPGSLHQTTASTAVPEGHSDATKGVDVDGGWKENADGHGLDAPSLQPPRLLARYRNEAAAQSPSWSRTLYPRRGTATRANQGSTSEEPK
eukprot:m.13593 g.13593  ORF g.13593 m.13593 type:complete len:166 (+) comp10186_c0_seq1:966-1463(+)